MFLVKLFLILSLKMFFRLGVKNMPEAFIRIILVLILPVIALKSLLFQYKVEAHSFYHCSMPNCLPVNVLTVATQRK